MKSYKFTFVKSLQPLFLCFGMLFLAIASSVVICCSTFIAFNSMKPDNGMAKVKPSSENAQMKISYASMK